ncbi:MAG: hypothetical protein K2X93_09440 [Candidatus Obscuribacterales bacterium]|nr:hypothetical protein [Candidatus Obscuribacterales bacterium]
MLFSSPDVANFINANFEPVWESVRPVPKITIDFGNGKKMTRTVNGNIASYICTSDGCVVDVIPGIYDADTYLADLQDLKQRYNGLPIARGDRANVLAKYHASARPRAVAPRARTADYYKLASPLLVKALKPRLAVTDWTKQALLDDVTFNENERRPQIHAYLADRPLSKPEDIKKWLYREVLHADLDDPYLGFDKILSKSYPFDDAGGT